MLFPPLKWMGLILHLREEGCLPEWCEGLLGCPAFSLQTQVQGVCCCGAAAEGPSST